MSDAEPGRDLRHADDVFLEVAEHLVRLAADGVTRDASRFAEERQRSAFVGRGHRVAVPSRKLIERRVGEHEREFELGDRLAEHEEIDRRAVSDFGKDLPEEFPVRFRSVQDLQRLLPNRLVPRSSRRVRQRHRLAGAIVELAEVGAECRVRHAVRTDAVEAADFDQLRRRHVRLRLQQMRHAMLGVVGVRETEVRFGKRKAEAG